MKEMVQYLMSLIIIFPYLMMLLLYFSVKVIGKSSVRSFRIAADLTVPLLFLSVCILLRVVVHIHAGFYLLTGILVIGIGFAVAERIRSKEFRIQNMLRNFWRMLFLVLSLFYIILLLLGIVKNVIEFLQG